MTSYIPSGAEIIAKRRAEGGDDFGTDLFSEGLRVNFAKKPWNPSDAALRRTAGLTEEEEEIITLGDPDFNLRKYLADAQVPSAHAESLVYEAQEDAQKALDQYGHLFDADTKNRLARIAETGQAEKGSNWFTNGLNILDSVGELIRMAIADVSGADEKHNTEIELGDYWDAFIGNEELLREKHGVGLVGEGQFLFEGARLLETWVPEGNRGAQAGMGFFMDVVLDPLTWVSFGTLGLGKKVAIVGAKAGLVKAGREAVEAVAKGTVKEIGDSAAREIAERMLRKVDDVAAAARKEGGVIAEIQARETALTRVLAEEKRALDLTEGIGKIPKRTILGDVAVPEGTVFQGVFDEVVPHLADKQFKTLAKSSPWYTASKNIPGYAKGGVQIGTPFGRKRFPMIRIPGTETDRLASRLFGRNKIASAFEKLPANVQSTFKHLAERVGSEQSVYKAAREGTLWTREASEVAAKAAVEGVLTVESIGYLRHGVQAIKDVAENEEAAYKIIREALSSGPQYLDTLDPKIRLVIQDAIYGNVDEGIVGLKTVFDTFHDAAKRVGLDIGYVDKYVPMVLSKKFGKLLDNLAQQGVTIDFAAARSTDSRVGMEILNRYLNNTGEAALGVAGSDPGYAKFAQKNKATSIYRHGLGGHEIYNMDLVDIVEGGGLERLTLDQANKAVSAALEDLSRVEPKVTRKVIDSLDEAFNTNMDEVFSSYVASMTEAIQFRALIRELRRQNLVAVGKEATDISATLASVAGKLNSESARWIDDLAQGAGKHRASRLVSVKAGGRTLKVPASVSANPRFKEATKKLGRVFSRTARKGREMEEAYHLRVADLVNQGMPKEVAERAALASTDKEVLAAISDVADAAVEEIHTLRAAVLEAAARGQVGDEAIEALEREARILMNGAQETINEIESQFRHAIGVPAPSSGGQVIDFLNPANAPQGYSNPIQWLADQFELSVERRVGKLSEFVQGQPGQQARLAGASRAQMAQEAAFDLGDRLTVANTTIGDVVEFSNPRTVARVLYESDFRLIDAGYAGVGAMTDEIRIAVQAVEEAEDLLLAAHLAGDGVQAAEEALRLAERGLDEAAEVLSESDEYMGPIVDNLAHTVDEINDSVLVSPQWRDVWATPLHQQKITRGLAKLSPEEVASGLDDLTLKELTQRHAKGVARENADSVRNLWQMASSSEEDFVRHAATQAAAAPAPRMVRALRAMKQGDYGALRAYEDEVRQIIGGITDEAGRPIFDARRLRFADDTLVYDPEEIAFIALDDVMDDIKSIVDQPNLTDLEQISIAHTTWVENPEVIEDFSETLATFMRQIDGAGGLPPAIEDYEYLRRFVQDLGELAEGGAKATVDEATKILDQARKTLKGGGGRKALDKLWDASKGNLEKALPADEYQKLADLVGTAQAAGEIKPSSWPRQWRKMLGEATDAFDEYTMDIATMRRQAHDLYEPWAESMAADYYHFHETLTELMGYADDTSRNIAPGFANLGEIGGEFDQQLKAVQKAANKLRKTILKGGKDKRIASFFPELPEGVEDLGRWLDELDRNMKNWRPVRTGTATPGMIPAEMAALGGESVEHLVMTPATALFLENLAVGAATLPSPYGIRMAAESMREVEKWWKGAATVARPTFVPRNVMGGVVNGLLIGVGPRHYAFVRNHAWKFRQMVEGGMEPLEAIAKLPDDVQPYFKALWESELLTKSFSHTLEGLQGAVPLSKRLNPASHANAVFHAGGKIMESSEDFLRAAAFVRWYDPNNPATAKLAKEMALAVHFDYSALTAMESKIKRFVPFFVWTRRNLPLQMRAMVEQPGHALRLLHLKENVGVALGDDTFVDEVGFGASPYLSAFAIKTPVIFDEDTPYWQRLILDPDIPVSDVEEALNAFSGGPKEWLNWTLRSLSPVYSAPLEVLEDYDTVAPTGLREIMMFSDLIPGVDPEKSGDDYIVTGGAASAFSTALPFLGEWARIGGLVPSSGTQAARAGYNIEDGVTLDERLKASALSMGRAVGTHLQTPADARSRAYESIFGIEDEIDKLRRDGLTFDSEEDLAQYLSAILSREGIEDSDLRGISIPGLDN